MKYIQPGISNQEAGKGPVGIPENTAQLTLEEWVMYKLD